MAKKDLFRGDLSMLVLSLIEKSDMYGYQIIKEMKKRSNNVFELQEGSLYPVLHSLESDGLVKSYIGETESARKRRYYSITEKGVNELSKKKQEFYAFTDAAHRVLSFA